MIKDTVFSGQPLFNQLLSLVPRSLLTDLSHEFQTDRYCKRFRGYDHLITMLYACFNRCGSLREVITGMQANSHRLGHLGLLNTPRRSTLSDANNRTNPDFFMSLFHKLHRHHYGVLPDSLKRKRDKEKLFIIDSTTISLFSQVMKGAGSHGKNGRKKGGAKAHVVINAKQDLPCFVRITQAKECDKAFLGEVDFLPKGSVVVMDKGYNVYKQFSKWTDEGVTWITRLNKAAVYRQILENKLTARQISQGVEKDLVIELGNPDTVHKNPLQTVRLILFFDKHNNRHFSFISNDLTCSPIRIANMYKKRWQIECLFKRFKSNFPLRYFLGDSENAIKIQIWCSLIADLLISLVKDKVKHLYKRNWSFANLAGLIRQHLTTYINIYAFLSNPEKALFKYKPPDHNAQLFLFSRGRFS